MAPETKPQRGKYKIIVRDYFTENLEEIDPNKFNNIGKLKKKQKKEVKIRDFSDEITLKKPEEN